MQNTQTKASIKITKDRKHQFFIENIKRLKQDFSVKANKKALAGYKPQFQKNWGFFLKKKVTIIKKLRAAQGFPKSGVYDTFWDEKEGEVNQP